MLLAFCALTIAFVCIQSLHLRILPRVLHFSAIHFMRQLCGYKVHMYSMTTQPLISCLLLCRHLLSPSTVVLGILGWRRSRAIDLENHYFTFSFNQNLPLSPPPTRLPEVLHKLPSSSSYSSPPCCCCCRFKFQKP